MHNKRRDIKEIYKNKSVGGRKELGVISHCEISNCLSFGWLDVYTRQLVRVCVQGIHLSQSVE